MDGLSVPSHGLKLLVGSGNPALSKEIAASLGVDQARATISRFADGEIFVRIDENVRGNDVFILQPTNPPAENIMELLLLIDAAKRASAARITCVMPYYGYSRQDRKDQPRVAIGATAWIIGTTLARNRSFRWFAASAAARWLVERARTMAWLSIVPPSTTEAMPCINSAARRR